MRFIYDFIIYIVSVFLPFIALFNKKIKLFVNGRSEILKKLAVLKEHDKIVWVHAASLGEFEQGRPIIEKIKTEFPDYKIVVTFFSPSGYEIRKNYNLADVVSYLPFDRKSKIKKFLQQLHPDLAIIIKYEFWPNLLNELKFKQVPTILVSGIFREKQIFFKWYGGYMREALKTFRHFYVQNNQSKILLNSINFKNVIVSGDTRFDRVSEILHQNNQLDFIDEFKNNKYTVVAGSTWKEDEELLIDYINTKASDNEKFIIAPHNINKGDVTSLKLSIKKRTILFSEKQHKNLSDFQVFIIDSIGMLTKIYSYADVAYVGGGLATGLHNILEPATFGIPIIFGGNKYHKFQEANDLLKNKSVTIVTNKKELSTIFVSLKNNEGLRTQMGTLNSEYIKNNTGATHESLKFIRKIL
ncbi:glycosyltransferase N-terminal domain-containing protein [Tenacibaculum sp.]|nr:glycosyltransferase N-terminal domain-containing protein [Tenacibaculum sp.]